MLRVPIGDVKAGMRLAVDIFDPTNGRRLLRQGYELEGRVIAGLARLHVHEIWIDYPGSDAVRRYISPDVVRHHGQLVRLLADVIGDHTRERWGHVDFTPFRSTVTNLVSAMTKHEDAAIYLVEMGGGVGSALRHASEVTFISLLMGIHLRQWVIDHRPRLDESVAGNLSALGVGALLADVGMELIDTHSRLTNDEESPGWQRHVALGHQLLTGRIPPAAAGVVLHHHQYFDGSGFPKVGEETLVGEAIHVFPRIVCVADHFDRLRYRDDGSIVPRWEVLERMRSLELVHRFDPVVLDALEAVVPAFSPGSVVTLSDGRSAVVTTWNCDAPSDPSVRVIETDEEIDLAQSDLMIAELAAA